MLKVRRGIVGLLALYFTAGHWYDRYLPTPDVAHGVYHFIDRVFVAGDGMPKWDNRLTVVDVDKPFWHHWWC